MKTQKLACSLQSRMWFHDHSKHSCKETKMKKMSRYAVTGWILWKFDGHSINDWNIARKEGGELTVSAPCWSQKTSWCHSLLLMSRIDGSSGWIDLKYRYQRWYRYWSTLPWWDLKFLVSRCVTVKSNCSLILEGWLNMDYSDSHIIHSARWKE